MTRRRFASGFVLALWAGGAHAFTPCICDMPRDRDNFQDFGAGFKQVWQTFVEHLGVPNPPTIESESNALGQLKRIQNEYARIRAAEIEQTAKMVSLSNFKVKEFRITKVKQTYSDNDAAASIDATLGIAGACSNAKAAQSAGRALGTQAAALSQLGASGRQAFNRIENPIDEVLDTVGQQDPARVPEFIGSYAGTLDPGQMQNFMSGVSHLMPVPPRNPASLPTATKDRQSAAIYNSVFKRAESAFLFLIKPFTREAAMMAPSVELTQSLETAWSHVAGGVTAIDLAQTPGGGPSIFPDHGNLLRPVLSGGKRLISERDLLRVEIYKRYANPQYQSDPVYGLTSKSSSSLLLKELIAAANIRSRLIYEIMNSRLHAKQVYALIAAAQNEEATKASMEQLSARLAAD